MGGWEPDSGMERRYFLFAGGLGGVDRLGLELNWEKGKITCVVRCAEKARACGNGLMPSGTFDFAVFLFL